MQDIPFRISHTTERISTLTLALGECPVWDEQRQQLWCLDCLQGFIYAVNPDTGHYQQHKVPAPCGSFALNHDGRLVLALKDSVALYDPKTQALQPLAERDITHPNLRFNDGSVMPDGSFVVGTMHIFRGEGEPPLGGLYRLDIQGRLQKLDGGLAVVNGPCISPINQRLHVCDSAAKVIYGYAVDEQGLLSDKRIFADTSSLQSAPDGCCFDTEGGLWTALVHAGALARFDAQGQLSTLIQLPVEHLSSVCFGGPSLDDIYITSISNSGRLHADGPLDGAILRVTNSGYQGAQRPVGQIKPLI